MLKKNATTAMMTAALGLSLAPLASADLIGHWEFESAPGGVTPDSAPAGGLNDGTLQGESVIYNDPIRGNVFAGERWYPGETGTGVDVDNTVAIPNLAADAGVTLAAWINLSSEYTNLSELAYTIGLGASYDNPIATIGVSDTGTVVGYIEGNGDDQQVRVAGAEGAMASQVGTWTHIAITYDRADNVGKVYIDGVQSGSDVDISGVGDGELDWGYATIGRHNEQSGSAITPKTHFAGLIDDARYYDEALDASAVAALVPEPGSLALLGLGGLMAARRRRD